MPGEVSGARFTITGVISATHHERITGGKMVTKEKGKETCLFSRCHQESCSHLAH
jgi:hypothetical protein